MMTPHAHRAVFLDRDGTIIEDVGYPRDPATVRLLPGVEQSLAHLSRQGFLLVLVSNQSGIGRGMVSPAEAEAVHARLVRCLWERGVRLAGAYYCPHAPDAACGCRKPSPGLLQQAACELQIDLGQSFMVGDKDSDIEAGRRAGCRTVLLRADSARKAPAGHADAAVADWPAILEAIRTLANQTRAC